MQVYSLPSLALLAEQPVGTALSPPDGVAGCPVLWEPPRGSVHKVCVCVCVAVCSMCMYGACVSVYVCVLACRTAAVGRYDAGVVSPMGAGTQGRCVCVRVCTLGRVAQGSLAWNLTNLCDTGVTNLCGMCVGVLGEGCRELKGAWPCQV